MQPLDQTPLSGRKFGPKYYHFKAPGLTKPITDVEDDAVPTKDPFTVIATWDSSQYESLVDITGQPSHESTACTITITPAPTWRLPDDIVDIIVSSTTVTGSFDALHLTCHGVSLEDDNIDYDPLEIKVESETIHIDKGPLYQEILGIYSESTKDNWDGYGAPAIPESAFWEALDIIDLLPSNFPFPEPSPEASGEIVFEWYKGTRNLFIIGVSGKNTISYAGLFGEHSETHGVEYFNGTFPVVILEYLKRLFGQ